MRRSWGLLSAVVLSLSACAPAAEEEGDVHDDAEIGDSLPPDAKADGYSVPASLGLDKRKIVYLTFDDGPSPVHTPRILDTLAAHGAKATFFITGRSIAGNEHLIRRMRDEGHIVANHQWSHVVATSGQFRGYVTKERDLLREIAGEMPLYFRYPYGAMTTWKEGVLKQEGYLDGGVGWDVDTLDWDFGPDGVAARREVPAAYKRDFMGYVLFRTEQRGGGVMLFHDVQSVTAMHLDALLEELTARGYSFGELPRKRGFIGSACEEDGDCSFEGAFCLGGLCTRACTGSCPDRPGFPTTRCARLSDGEGGEIDACAQDCSAAACRAEAAACVDAVSPAGATRRVCWTM
jgi:peptidoglycan/xylan/chitin deacetylase (PgdA/CDA1 family)